MLTLENTWEVFAGLCVVGIAANATFDGLRMGPIFGTSSYGKIKNID